jgi:hypothetical protein
MPTPHPHDRTSRSETNPHPHDRVGDPVERVNGMCPVRPTPPLPPPNGLGFRGSYPDAWERARRDDK